MLKTWLITEHKKLLKNSALGVKTTVKFCESLIRLLPQSNITTYLYDLVLQVSVSKGRAK